LFYLMIGWGVWTALEGDLFGGIWIVLVGWFLLTSARREQSVQNATAGHTRDDHDGLGFNVGLASRPMPSMIDVYMTVFEVQSRAFLIDTPVSIPVARDGGLVGFITPEELSELPESERTEVVIAQIMNPDSLRVISASEPARNALRTMDRYRVSQLVVMEKTHLLGMVTRQDVLAKMSEFTLSEDAGDALGSA
jgi:CBS domain-containing protein